MKNVNAKNYGTHRASGSHAEDPEEAQIKPFFIMPTGIKYITINNMAELANLVRKF